VCTLQPCQLRFKRMKIFMLLYSLSWILTKVLIFDAFLVILMLEWAVIILHIMVSLVHMGWARKILMVIPSDQCICLHIVLFKPIILSLRCFPKMAFPISLSLRLTQDHILDFDFFKEEISFELNFSSFPRQLVHEHQVLWERNLSLYARLCDVCSSNMTILMRLRIQLWSVSHTVPLLALVHVIEHFFCLCR